MAQPAQDNTKQTPLLQPWRAAWPHGQTESTKLGSGQVSALQGFRQGEQIIQGGQSGQRGDDDDDDKAGKKPLYDTAEV